MQTTLALRVAARALAAKIPTLAERVAARVKAGEAPMGSAEFMEALKKQVDLKGRILKVKNYGLGQTDHIYVTLINLPEGIGGAGGGAEAENNRLSLSVWGFDKKDEHAAPPTGKVKVELSVNALGRDKVKFRGRTDTPEKIVKYIADFLSKVVKDVEPNYTHSKPPGA